MVAELSLPKASDALGVASNLKALLAVSIFDPAIKVAAADDIPGPVLKVDEKHLIVEPNAIVRYLSKTFGADPTLTFEESVLYDVAKHGGKLDDKQSQDVLAHVPKTETSAGGIAFFSTLHGLVTVHGKGALSKDLQLLLWYQKTSGNARVQPVLKNLQNYSGPRDEVPGGHRVASIAKIKAPVANNKEATKEATKEVNNKDAAAERPKPQRTEKPNIAAGVEVKKHGDKILPQKGERNILITSALPYVNNVPHLGNIVGSVLSADIFARYAKARNYNALFVCGTDEYGTATETKALEEGVTPRELVNKYNKIHAQVYDWFQIGFDYFGRTSTDKQTEIAQDIFLKLHKNGYLEEQSTEQLYCPVHNGFLADRFVEGTCPKCGYEDARGDQCDVCGQLLNPFELIKPRCKLDNAQPEKRQTNHIFLSLDKLQDQVAEWNAKAQEEGSWSKNGRQITQNWLREGLRPRAITRDLKWGVQVPLDGYRDKVLYVWFDACIGYVSITANYTDEWEQWWKDPEHVKLYQFMGKDNVPFHTVVFPSSQFGTKENWTMLHHLSTTEYLQYEGGKFSKSRNIGVFGNNAQEVGLSPSVWRYYLAMARPETSDTQFSWKDFVARNNNELLANLGNFVNRIVKYATAKYNGVIPEFKTSDLETYSAFEADVNKLLAEYVANMEAVHLRNGVELAMSISARGNQFLQDNKMDNSLYANFPEKAAAVVGVGLNLIYLLSAVISPFMPETTDSIVKQLNAHHRSIPDKFDLALLPGHNIGKAAYLFKRIEDSKVDEWRQKYGGGSGV